MASKTWVLLAVFAVSVQASRAADLKITLPKRSESTPVQRLNREGVQAVRKHDFEKAKGLFYRAYLYDPDDPFTLNNLGYIAELEGQLDRALRFYTLAAQRNTEAVIETASSKQVEGRSFVEQVNGIRDRAVQINLANVTAVKLLSEGRASEADLLLQKTLAVDPHHPFTLNNMGVAKEMQGDLGAAARYYTAAAASRSNEPVVVTVNPQWRGKPVSDMAADSAKKVLHRLRHPESNEAKAAEYNLRGVSALNRNDWKEAEQDFREAYALDPSNAFSLNNAGYLAEMYGDRETAQFFYDKARQADGAKARIGVATDRGVKGWRLSEVAADNDQKIDQKMTQDSDLKRRQSTPIQLKRRDGTPVTEPAEVPKSPAQNVPNSPGSNNEDWRTPPR
jgi:Flp pilus assembly protein TadD